LGYLSFLFAFVSGAFITMQAGSNSQVKKSLGSPMPAVVVNYLVGITCIVVYMLIEADPLPEISKAARVPWLLRSKSVAQ
jgi:bacterial/archaeal transporter family-2 protein